MSPVLAKAGLAAGNEPSYRPTQRWDVLCGLMLFRARQRPVAIWAVPMSCWCSSVTPPDLLPYHSHPITRGMCGRVIQSSGPLRLAIVDGRTVHESRVSNYPPRYNAAPNQDLLVIRRNRQTGEVSLEPLRWGLIPHRCRDPDGGRKPINAKAETVAQLPTFRDAYARRRCILPVDGFF
jgi:hypothetical protein